MKKVRLESVDLKNKYLGGRPTVMTESVLGKLKEAFMIGCTDTEACLYADINPDTLYDYQKKNEWFSELKKQWKENPVLKARTTVYKNLDDKETAMKYLERKKKDEFSLRSEVTGADGEAVAVFNFNPPKDANNSEHKPTT
jgi:hypothetical protein